MMVTNPNQRTVGIAIYTMVKKAYSKMDEDEGQTFYDALSGKYQQLADSVAKTLVSAVLSDQQIDKNEITSTAKDILESPTTIKKEVELGGKKTAGMEIPEIFHAQFATTNYKGVKLKREKKEKARLNIPKGVLEIFSKALYEGLTPLKNVFRNQHFMTLQQNFQAAKVSI